jgi:hypothetical protein
MVILETPRIDERSEVDARWLSRASSAFDCDTSCIDSSSSKESDARKGNDAVFEFHNSNIRYQKPGKTEIM